MPYNEIKTAVVQAAPVLFDKEKTVKKASELIDEAYDNGAKLVLFPEAFIPAYPRGSTFDTDVGHRTEKGRELWNRYYEESVEIPGQVTDELGKKACENQIFLAIGVIEKISSKRGGTLYCTVVYIGPDGNILGKHRKIKPTGTERVIWGEGDGSTLTVVDTDYGKVGGLICWENYMPMARMAMYDKGIEIYLAPTADSRERWQATLKHIALEGRCFVLGCNQYVTEDMYPDYFKEDIDDFNELNCRGGSVIVSPMGEVIEGPLYNQEGILYAELDMKEICKSRFDFDVTGHYSRPDIFKLLVNEERQDSILKRK